MSKFFSNFSGILLLDKPLGITSNAALQRVKRLLKANKAGHTGNLDPLATGMLPICVGSEATKFSSYLLAADKQYEVCIQLGISTTTGDAEGEIVTRSQVKHYSPAKLLSVLQTFSGEIEQIPPMFSAIKQNGKPLYELARKGITVERSKRKVHIYDLQLLDQQAETITLSVHCSKGTYIRSLAEDIGRVLECGAYVSALRRLGVGSYSPSQMISLAELEHYIQLQPEFDLQQFILPIHSCLTHLPNVSLDDNLLFYLQRGQPIRVNAAPLQGSVKLFTLTGNFIGIGQILEDGRIAPRRLVSLISE